MTDLVVFFSEWRHAESWPQMSSSWMIFSCPKTPPQGWPYPLKICPFEIVFILNLMLPAEETWRSTQRASHRADSFSMWQEVVVVALPSLLSFRKLGFSIATETATSLLVGFSNVVNARFSEVLADSPSLWIKIKPQDGCLIKHKVWQQQVFSPYAKLR